MRAAKVGFLGLSALLSARIIAGCSSGQGEAGFDAGSLDELELPAQGASASDDAGMHLQGSDGGDATTAGQDGASGGDDGGTDSRTGQATDASDAGDAATSSADASDGAVATGHDAGDAATSEVDAGDASTPADAGAGDAGAPDAGGGDATVADAGAEDAATSEDAGSSEDAGVDASDGAIGPSDDAGPADAAPACVSCGTTITFIGNTAAYQTGTGNSVGLQNGTVVDGASVSVVTQTYPQNSVGQIHLLYSTDSGFASPVNLVMTFDHTVGNNDQWFAILPVESANTTVYWYMRADGCDCATSLYGQPGPLQNYSYTEQ